MDLDVGAGGEGRQWLAVRIAQFEQLDVARSALGPSHAQGAKVLGGAHPGFLQEVYWVKAGNSGLDFCQKCKRIPILDG